MLPHARDRRSALPSPLLRALVCLLILAIAPPSAWAKPARGGGDKGDEGGGAQGGGDDGGGDDGGGDENDNSNDEKRKNGEGEENVIVVIVATPLDYLETPCVEERDADKCFEAGVLWKQGVPSFKEGKPDLRRADNFLRTACYFGHGQGCLLAAKMHLAVEAGIVLKADGGVLLDFVTAADLLDKGCRAGVLSACSLGGDLYFSPEAMLPNDQTSFDEDRFREDQIAARQLYEMGCPAAWLPGGALRADLRDGKFPPVDPVSCKRMGEMFARGITMRPVVATAAKYLDLACWIDDTEEVCDRAEELGEEAEEEEARKAARKASRTNLDDELGRTEGRGNGALASRRPNTNRFDDDAIGLEEKESIVRFEFELPLGVRWAYGPTIMPLFVTGIAIDFWFALVGLGVDFTYSTDDLFRPSARDYGRVQVAILGKVAIPLPVRMTIPARLIFVPSIGGSIGSRSLSGSDAAALMGGLVERIELRLQTEQRKGARQWGGIRFEQQQSWVQYTHGGVEHASQFTFVFGFTFGGVGPEIPKKKAKAGDE